MALPIREVAVVVDNDVAGLAGGLRADNALGRDDLTGERGLVLVGVGHHGRLIVVWRGLEEVLLKVQGGSGLFVVDCGIMAVLVRR